MSDGGPVDLAAFRAQREEAESGEHLACEVCGGVWWMTDVVIDKQSDRVVGYNADLVCSECIGVEPR